jgi:copper chaperone CopZ
MATTTVHLRIEGMSCEHCVQTLQRELLGTDGVEAVTISLKDKAAMVQYNAAVIQPATLVTAVEEAGYQASVK